jgi:hypothetical protein
VRTLGNAFVVGIIAAAISGGAYAQWPSFKSTRVPRTPDGKPVLDGPTPRTPDGKPDLSGVWQAANAAAASGTGPAAAAPGTRPSQFWNIGSTLKDGLPFTAWGAEVRKQRGAENNKDNPDAHCLPVGLMQLDTHPQPRKIIQTPNELVILYEAQAGVRQIFTDGRSLPKDDVQPWWYAYSIGHWEADTLVVETIGFRDDVWLDVEGSPLTHTGKMTERYHRPNYGTLLVDVTVEDPKAYTKPWSVTITNRIMPDTELMEFICNENERDTPHFVGK